MGSMLRWLGRCWVVLGLHDHGLLMGCIRDVAGQDAAVDALKRVDNGGYACLAGIDARHLVEDVGKPRHGRGGHVLQYEIG